MNPELQRNLWLEAGPARLAWTGVTLAILFGASLLVGADPRFALAAVGTGVFIVSALIWGPRAAGRAIGTEVLQRTWDFQRLSALTPWEMTLGKLVGSTSLSWLAAGVGLFVTAAVLAARDQGEAAAWMVVAGAALAVMLQAGSLALALVGVRRARADGRPPAMRIGWGAIVGGLILLWAMQQLLPKGMVGAGGLFADLGGSRSWWGWEPPGQWFLAVSLIAFAAWSVVAAWRLMRLELQMQNLPWAWPGFVLFAGLYLAGLVETMGPGGRAAAAGVAFGIAAYAAAFAEPADRVRVRMFAAAVRAQRWSEAMLKVPAPLAPMKYAILAAIAVAVLPGAFTGRVAGQLTLVQPGLTALAAAAFLVRDIGVIAYFRFGPRTRRGDFGAVLGLFLLYFVGGMVGSSLGGEAGAALFRPTLRHAALGVGAGIVEAALVWVLAWGRIKAPEAAEVG